MKIVKVTYTTTADYASKNMANIEAVMQDLRNLANPDINIKLQITTSNGLPQAMQLVGRPFDEPLLFRVGAAYEAARRATVWHQRVPARYPELIVQAVDADEIIAAIRYARDHDLA